MSYVSGYLDEVKAVVDGIDRTVIEKIVDLLVGIRENGGRLFFLGVGGGAGNASHAVNDFRKIAGIESYSPSDNVSELTARTNDEGWDTVFVEWLKCSKLNQKDGIFVFSVGGRDAERNISANLVRALEYAQTRESKIMGIVGRDGGYAGKVGDACLIIPTVNQSTITTHTEAFQSVIWHLVVSHPNIQVSEMKWESTTE
ncbi:MAG: SIS domain-containing protein [Chloroflexi bacterium]|nr:SIS domain-containing protein [Chloroflexota bacterium]